MAEAVGLVASIVQLASATLRAMEYIEDVKGALESRKKGRDELRDLHKVLLDLRDTVEEAKTQESWFQGVRSLAEEGRPLHQIKAAIEELISILKPTSSMKSAGKALIWTLDKKKVAEILMRIERAKSSIIITLQQSHLALARATKVGVEEIAGSVSILRQTQRQKEISERQRAITNWISPINFHLTHNDIFSARQKGTGQWLLESDSFKSWLDGTSRILWCPGIPGAGKTVLASTAIDLLRKNFADADNAYGFIYCNYKKQAEQSPINLVSALLKQFVEQKPSIVSDLEFIYAQHSKKDTRPTLQEISKALQSAISSFSRVFIVVDALDECSEFNNSRSDLLDVLGVLGDTVSLMITSRPNIRIEDIFPDREELEITATEDDVHKYLEARISQTPRLTRLVRANTTLRAKIKDAISENVKGMFLLARLHMDSIAKKHSLNQVIKALSHLPQGLDDTYEEAMQRIEAQNEDDRKLAKRVLSWVVFAKVPLSVIELQHALAITPGATKLDNGDIIDEEIFLSICAGLVSIEQESGLIHLVHYTTQVFFERVRDNWFPHAQLDIARSCLTYLLFDVLAKGPCSTDEDLEARLQQNPLLRYAALHWSDHINENSEHLIQDLILAFLGDNSRISSYVQVRDVTMNKTRYGGYSQEFRKNVVGLHIVASSGLETTTQLLLEEGANVNAKDSNLQTALSLVANRGYEAVVRRLLERSDIEVNLQDVWGWTALSLAAKRGYEAVVRRLLERSDVEVNSKDNWDWTALHFAACNGHEAIVRHLIERSEVEVNLKDDWGWTALHLAACNGHEAIVRHLIERSDIEVNLKDDKGRTALQYAAKNGHEAVARCLMERSDVEVNSKDKWGRTAYSYALRQRHIAIMQLLEQALVS